MDDARLGPLERRVLEALWSHGREARVRDLKPYFPDIAYTTLMTTVDRLHRKGLLARNLGGRAFVYSARVSRGQMRLDAAVDALKRLIDGGDSIDPVLSFLIDEVGGRDQKALDELERLIRDRRRARENES